MEAFSNMDRPKTRSSRPRIWTVFGLVYPCIRNPEFYKTVRHSQATLSFQSSLAKPNMYGTNTQPFTYLSKASPVHSPNLLQISPSIPEQPQESQQAELRPELPFYMYVWICVCMYVSSYVDDAGELKSCKQSSIRKASKEFRQSNERCGRVALDRSIAKPAFEKFAKNHQIHKFFGPGCWPLAQNP